ASGGEAFERSTQVALGIDQEIRADDNALPFLHAFENLCIAIAARAHLDRARREPAFAPFDKDDLARAGVDDRSVRYNECRFPSRRYIDFDARIHIAAQSEIAVRHDYPYPCRSGIARHGRIDDINPAV